MKNNSRHSMLRKMDTISKTELLHKLERFRRYGHEVEFNQDMTKEELAAIFERTHEIHMKEQQRVDERLELRMAILRGESSGQIDSNEAVRLVATPHSSKDLQDFVDQKIKK